MPLTVNAARASFTLSGPDVEPDHWAWAMAGPRERVAYYRRLGMLAIDRLRYRLGRGEGADGRRLKPVKPESRGDGATGPPLSPHQAGSRFQKWLRAFGATDRCTVYWSHGWAIVARGHREGARHLPVRDVVGLKPADLKWAVQRARAEWDRGRGMKPAAQAVAIPKPKPKPKTPAAPLPPQPVAPPTPRPAPTGDLLADVRATLAELGPLAGLGRKSRAVHELLAARAAGPRVSARVYGMAEAEEFDVLEFGGIRLYYRPLGAPEPGKLHPAVSTLLDFAAVPEPPPALTAATRAVYLTGQRSAKDAVWAAKFNKPDFRARAEGGAGDVVVYGDNPLDPVTFAHEAGHNLATARFGSITPPGSSEFAAAATSGEAAPTRYGATFLSEDFAEATMLYATDPDRLRREAPRRYEALRKLMGETGRG